LLIIIIIIILLLLLLLLSAFIKRFLVYYANVWVFTTNQAISGPPLHRDRALLPPWTPLPGLEVRGGLRWLCCRESIQHEPRLHCTTEDIKACVCLFRNVKLWHDTEIRRIAEVIGSADT